MSISLIDLKRIIDEEDVIGASIRWRRLSNEDLKITLVAVNQNGWAQDGKLLVKKNIWSLRHALRDMDESLKIHYYHEVNTYSSTLGSSVIAGLELDHRILLAQLDKIVQLIETVTDENIRRKAAKIYKEIDIFCQMLESQNEKDKSMLLWLKNLILEKNHKRPNV